ncbi:AAA family ATPase [Mammaliicoccus sciuri]|uniref:AAA family ATPase n=1 Tax=Mammaliicoccus sciuri TaxID=1296 RepID=UPI00374EA013
MVLSQTLEDQRLKDKFEEINDFLGGALVELDQSGSEVLERETELRYLDIIMGKRDKPVAMLIGGAGTGKTALVEEYARRESMSGNMTIVFAVNIGALSAGGTHKLKERFEMLLPKAKEYQDILQEKYNNAKVILFIDEVHRIISVFGQGSKEGGDILKPTLARAGKYVRVIAATTDEEYNRYIAKDSALKRRFDSIMINEVSQEITLKILRQWLTNKIGETEANQVKSDVLDRIIQTNKLMQSDLNEPAKSLEVIEMMLSVYEQSHEPMDHDLINFVFKMKNIELDFDIDTKRITNTLRRRVRGQPLVLYTMERMIDLVAWHSKSRRSSNRPRGTVLLVGTSGTGKTETVKAVAEGKFGDENKLKIFSMTDYDTEGSSDRFRLDLGSYVSQNKSAIILFDEIEKAHKSVILALLPILDEGIVTYFEEGADGYLVRQQASLRGSLIFATSNSGSEMFEDINKYSKELQDVDQDSIDVYNDQAKHSTKILEPIIQTGLERDFPKELLQRFTYFIPYRSLNNATKLDIANKMLAVELKQFLEEGYHIHLTEVKDWQSNGYPFKANEISMYIVFERMMKGNAGASGARNIQKIIMTDIVAEILKATRLHPNMTRFIIRTNGKCIFESNKDAISNGAIEVHPY